MLRSHRWRTAENSAGYLLPLLPPGMRLLDVGCGPGTITMDLADLVGPGGRVTALERTEDALDLARAEAPRRRDSNVDFAVGDVTAWTSPDGSFDVVHAHQVLQHVGDPVRALREMRRVCRPGGARRGPRQRLRGVHLVPAGGRARPVAGGLLGGRPVQRRRAGRGTPPAVLGACRGARRTSTAGSSTWCYSTPTDRAWWGGLWADRVVDSDLARQAVDRDSPPGGGRAISEGWRRWAAEDDGWFSVLHGEIVARGLGRPASARAIQNRGADSSGVETCVRADSAVPDLRRPTRGVETCVRADSAGPKPAFAPTRRGRDLRSRRLGGPKRAFAPTRRGGR